ncbi:MAG: FIST C-terminal domain-containing protein [Gammaproteobacteria bacterium]|nr:FIST C-terminal domain-containing protein [Gammaproteobacteria bacterium]
MNVRPAIRTAQSAATDARLAVCEFHRAVAQPDMGLVIFFCSSDYDLNVLAAEMAQNFAGVSVVGCTTAGEIGPLGYLEHTLVGASFSSVTCTAVTARLDGLRTFGPVRGQAFAQTLLQRLESVAPQADLDNSFAFMLIDGLATREELVTRVLQTALGKIPLFGGSAGNGLHFNQTHVYYEGCFHTDSAVLTLVSTTLPFRIFKTQHFVATDERLVITRADTANRIVKEINGLPAAEEYARLVGVDVRSLDPSHFATSPVVVLIDGAEYVRSIQKTNPDGSLTFYCAIEEGLVFRVAQGVDLVENLKQTFAQLREDIGPLQFVLGCDCVLRNLEITQSGMKGRVEEIFRDNHTVGFGTYGEQYNGVHVNQTLTGIAIGSEELANV